MGGGQATRLVRCAGGTRRVTTQRVISSHDLRRRSGLRPPRVSGADEAAHHALGLVSAGHGGRPLRVSGVRARKALPDPSRRGGLATQRCGRGRGGWDAAVRAFLVESKRFGTAIWAHLVPGGDLAAVNANSCPQGRARARPKSRWAALVRGSPLRDRSAAHRCIRACWVPRQRLPSISAKPT